MTMLFLDWGYSRNFDSKVSGNRKWFWQIHAEKESANISVKICEHLREITFSNYC